MQVDQLEVNNKVKEIQKLEVRNDNDSEASAASSRDSIENILLTLHDSNSFKMEEPLSITLSILFLAFLACFLGIYLGVRDWDNQDFSQSPVVQLNSFMLIRSYFNKAISWKIDSNDYEEMVLTGNTPALNLVNTLYSQASFPFMQFLSSTGFFFFQRYLAN